MDKKIVLLVVEDEASIRKVIVKKFIKEGFKVLEAVNGEKGLEIFIKERPDMILLDLIMPIMDGISMLKKIRQLDYGKNVPVIVLTNLSDAGKTAESIEYGVCDYLVKADWKLDDLVAKVKIRISEGCIQSNK